MEDRVGAALDRPAAGVAARAPERPVAAPGAQSRAAEEPAARDIDRPGPGADGTRRGVAPESREAAPLRIPAGAGLGGIAGEGTGRDRERDGQIRREAARGRPVARDRAAARAAAVAGRERLGAVP